MRLILALALAAFSLVQAARVLLSLYALSLGAQPFTVGLLGAMLYVVPLLLVWGIGVMFDRIGGRWLLLFGSVSGLIGMLLPFFWQTLPALFGAAALCGVSLAFSNVILQSLIGTLSAPAERTRNISNFSLIAASGNFLGPLVVGFSIDHLGHAAACLVLAMSPLAGVALLTLRGNMLPRAQNAQPHPVNPFETLAQPGIRRMLALSSLMQFGIDLFLFYLPIYGHSIGLSASTIGVVMSSYAVAAFAARIVMPALIERMGEEALLSATFFFGAGFFLLVPMSHSGLALATVSFLFGICVGCGGPLTLMLMFKHSSGRPGEALGLRLTVNYLTRMTGPTLCGLVAAALGLLPVFILNAAMMVVGGVIGRPQRGTQRQH